MILAYMKLRQRNLGPILDANGWAINARAKINVPFGERLTEIPHLPPGSTVDVSDRYAEKTAVWPKLLVFLFLVWWVLALLYDTGVLNHIPLGKSSVGLNQNSTDSSKPAVTNNPAPAAK
jgi:hypothetical protein